MIISCAGNLYLRPSAGAAATTSCTPIQPLRAVGCDVKLVPDQCQSKRRNGIRFTAVSHVSRVKGGSAEIRVRSRCQQCVYDVGIAPPHCVMKGRLPKGVGCVD